jgi:hypothetical protein
VYGRRAGLSTDVWYSEPTLAECQFLRRYHGSLEPVFAATRPAISARAARSRTHGRWDPCDPLLYRLPQPCKLMPSARGACIEAERTVVGERHATRHRYLAPTDQPCVRDRMVGARHGRLVTKAVRSEAGDTVDACGLNGLGEGHRRQDGGAVEGCPEACPSP